MDLLLAAVIDAAFTLTLPLPHSGDQAVRVSVVAENRGDAAVTCLFRAGDSTLSELVPPNAVNEIDSLRQPRRRTFTTPCYEDWY